MKIPDNYRQLKPDEIIRKGDLYRCENGGQIFPVINSSHLYTFWRRRHTKQIIVPPVSPVQVFVKRARASVSTATKPVKNVTVVSFHYNFRVRLVQVISLDKTYLTGLEITREQGSSKLKYQFKKYLLSRMGGNGSVQLEHFGAPLTN
jgi:hypothetical protein